MAGRKLLTAPPGQKVLKTKGIILHELQNFKPYCVRNLGSLFDTELNFIPYIKCTTKGSIGTIGSYHLNNIVIVSPFLLLDSKEVVMHAFIFSRVVYCNVLLSGLPKKRTFQGTKLHVCC